MKKKCFLLFLLNFAPGAWEQVMAWAPGGILSAYPSSYLHGRAAASGWAVVNAVGALLGGKQGGGWSVTGLRAVSRRAGDCQAQG